jgi:hypothetical protein
MRVHALVPERVDEETVRIPIQSPLRSDERIATMDRGGLNDRVPLGPLPRDTAGMRRRIGRDPQTGRPVPPSASGAFWEGPNPREERSTHLGDGLFGEEGAPSRPIPRIRNLSPAGDLHGAFSAWPLTKQWRPETHPSAGVRSQSGVRMIRSLARPTASLMR